MDKLNYIIIFVAFVGCLVYKTYKYTSSKKGLGELILETPTGLGNSDFIFQTVMAFLCFLVVFSSGYFNLVEDMMFKVMLGLLGFFFGYYIFEMYVALSPKGFYENGISTILGITGYDNISDYELAKRKKKTGWAIKFTPNKGLFPQVHFMYIEEEELSEVKKILKNKCTFKKGFNPKSAPRPKKRRK